MGEDSAPVNVVEPVQRQSPPGGLPSQGELANRISEAQTSAKVLEQMLLSTPKEEVPTNELIKEFIMRCKLARRSVQGYLAAESQPDEETVWTLIETNEVLAAVLEKHRAIVRSVQGGVEGAREVQEQEGMHAGGVRTGLPPLQIPENPSRKATPLEDPFRDQPSPVSPVVSFFDPVKRG